MNAMLPSPVLNSQPGFTRRLYYQAVPEWKDRYLRYRALKKQLVQLQHALLRMAARNGHDDMLSEEADFWATLEENFEMVENFYLFQISEAGTTFSNLVHEGMFLKLIDSYEPGSGHEGVALTSISDLKPGRVQLDALKRALQGFLFQGPPSAQLTPNEVTDMVITPEAKATLRRAFVEFYRGLMLLRNYCQLNVEGFARVTTQYDRKLASHVGDRYLTSKTANFKFWRQEALTTLIEECEHVFATAFEGSSHKRACFVLRNKFGQEDWLTFRLGMLTGIGVPLLTAAIFLSVIMENPLPERDSQAIFIVFRMVALVLCLLWFWGIDMFVWTKFRVNYVFIFDFDTRQQLTFKQVFEFATLFSLVWLVCDVMCAAESPSSMHAHNPQICFIDGPTRRRRLFREHTVHCVAAGHDMQHLGGDARLPNSSALLAI
eukprot:TRINITY_DN3740_c0_g1_i1.p1 TRINITY_DN3740_c0_g1~~TRINITY_DN3740_c0_g1_i1.p1  ORF type:complete len:450 (-),score=113.83 TRINITY_DN3740_c0_g1_i1:772-2070(-)